MTLENDPSSCARTLVVKADTLLAGSAPAPIRRVSICPSVKSIAHADGEATR